MSGTSQCPAGPESENGEMARSRGGDTARSGAGGTARSGAGGTARSGAGETARSGAGGTARSGAGGTARSGGGDTARSGAGETARSGAAALIPPDFTWRGLHDAAAGCRACDLWERGTQTVFGAGPTPAPVMLVGEQPGNEEDLSGNPFVGPAGRLLDRALVDAGIDRTQAYVTNVVKHFKWEPRGKRRIHMKPATVEIVACRPWLDAELEIVKPRVLVCLGATAAQALLGKQFRVTKERGKLIESPLAPYVMATVHPSSILRTPDNEARHREMESFVADLRKVAEAIHAKTRRAR
jgi:uracil-DNA glycosylase family protein